MLPSAGQTLARDFAVATLPSKTNALSWGKERMRGYCDGLEAVKQAVYMILHTERYEHMIYSWNYGVELADLIGKPIPYVYPEIKRRITEALTQDDRILSVGSFSFEKKKNKVHTTFVVQTLFGEIEAGKEVAV